MTDLRVRICALCGEPFQRPLDWNGKIAQLFCMECIEAFMHGTKSQRPQPYAVKVKVKDAS